MEVPVRELKNRLSEYLRKVQAGAEVVITSHGKAVARLVGPGRRRRQSAEDGAVEQLSVQSWIRAGSRAKLRGAERPTRVPAGTTDEIMNWMRGR